MENKCLLQTCWNLENQDRETKKIKIDSLDRNFQLPKVRDDGCLAL